VYICDEVYIYVTRCVHSHDTSPLPPLPSSSPAPFRFRRYFFSVVEKQQLTAEEIAERRAQMLNVGQMEQTQMDLSDGGGRALFNVDELFAAVSIYMLLYDE
jgi:hypothetical protein